MKKFGLRIGQVGVEFPSAEDRQKAIINFTKGTDVTISESGIKYKDGIGNFSVYDRDTKETITTCAVCRGEFSVETCSEREYPNKYSYSNEYHTDTGFVCDACFTKKVKDKEIFDAKKLVEESNE